MRGKFVNSKRQSSAVFAGLEVAGPETGGVGVEVSAVGGVEVGVDFDPDDVGREALFAGAFPVAAGFLFGVELGLAGTISPPLP